MANTVSPSTTTSPSARRGTAHLSPRTLINIGVFTAIYFVITYATGMLGFFNPFMMFVGWVVGILLNGTVIMLFLARTPTFGALTILNTIVGLLMFLTGHVWYTVLGAALVGLLADLVANSAHFRSPRAMPSPTPLRSSGSSSPSSRSSTSPTPTSRASCPAWARSPRTA